jgi:hypothetical protein
LRFSKDANGIRPHLRDLSFALGGMLAHITPHSLKAALALLGRQAVSGVQMQHTYLSHHCCMGTEGYFYFSLINDTALNNLGGASSLWCIFEARFPEAELLLSQKSSSSATLGLVQMLPMPPHPCASPLWNTDPTSNYLGAFSLGGRQSRESAPTPDSPGTMTAGRLGINFLGFPRPQVGCSEVLCYTAPTMEHLAMPGTGLESGPLWTSFLSHLIVYLCPISWTPPT